MTLILKRGCALSLLLVFCSAISFAAESAANRKKETVWFSVQPVGIHLPTLIAPTSRVGVFLGDNFVFGVGSGSATHSQTSGNTTSTASFTNQGVWARYFLGNSFNILAAYDTRTWTADVTVTETTGSVTATAQASLVAEASVGTLGLANHWTFDSGFTLGVDWLLASSVLNSSSTHSVSTNTCVNIGVTTCVNSGVNSVTLNKDLTDLGSVLNKISGLGGLTVLTLGWAF